MKPLLVFGLPLACLMSLATVSMLAAATNSSLRAWFLPEAREVEMGGSLGEAYDQGVKRLRLPPYDSAAYLRSDFSFETNRIFVNYSGDISGRYIQIASLVSPPGQMNSATLTVVLQDLARYQKADGHFGREVDWSQPLEPENSNAVLLPIFWGNSRLLAGLIEAGRAFRREDCLQAARRIGDFYIVTAPRFLDPAREPEYRMTGTYAAGYATDYFPGIEGLALLYQTTRDERYLRQAEQMAEFFKRFDTLPIDHSHGNLVTHFGLLLLHEATGKPEYRERPLVKWRQAVEGGFIWPMGGVGEKFRVSYVTDEGCSEADWLRLNLRLWQLAGETRFLDLAERLLQNHYAMNRTANGGYGHHNFVADANGPLLMKPQFTEAVWCCTFHGLLGLHTLKSYLVAGSPQGVFVNFPVNVSTPVQTGRGRWQVMVTATEAALGEVQCRVRLDPLAGADQIPEVMVRRPAWAERVAITDGTGRKLTLREEGGYLRLSLGAGAGGAAHITFAGPLRVEDRRLRPVALNPKVVSRYPGVTLLAGPHLLLANTDKPRPVLVARVGQDGSLVWPAAHRFPQVDRLDASDEQITQAIKPPQTTLQLAPWENTGRDAAAAFVFDLITIPVGAAVTNQEE